MSNKEVWQDGTYDILSKRYGLGAECICQYLWRGYHYLPSEFVHDYTISPLIDIIKVPGTRKEICSRLDEFLDVEGFNQRKKLCLIL